MAAGKHKFTLVIDAGHGGHDVGAMGKFSKEKDINLRTALAFGKYVERNCSDVKVVYTRKTDVFVTLHGRANIANKAKADLFISIHTNSLPGKKIARGFETYTLGMHRAADNLDVAKRENSVILVEKDYKKHYEGFDPNSSESYIIFEFLQDHNMAKSVELAKLVQNSVCSTANRPNKGVKQAGFLVLRETSMPSCLIELGFISTSDEEKYLNEASNIDNMARGIYQAFVKYKNKYNGGSSPSSSKALAQTEEPQQQEPENEIKEVVDMRVALPPIDTNQDLAANNAAKPSVKPQIEAPKPKVEAPKPQPEAKPKAEVPAQSPSLRQNQSQAPSQNQAQNQSQAQSQVQRVNQSQEPQVRKEPETPKPAQQQPKVVQQPKAQPAPQEDKTKAVAKTLPSQPTAEQKPQVAQQPKAEPAPKAEPVPAPAPKPAAQQAAPTQQQPQAQPKAKANAAPVGAPVFMIQIFISEKILDSSDTRFKGETASYYKEGRVYKYTLGASTDYNEIVELRKNVGSKFPGCFIVAFKNGEKVNINDAIIEYKINKAR